jgi:hypothetical protein
VTHMGVASLVGCTLAQRFVHRARGVADHRGHPVRVALEGQYVASTSTLERRFTAPIYLFWASRGCPSRKRSLGRVDRSYLSRCYERADSPPYRGKNTRYSVGWCISTKCGAKLRVYLSSGGNARRKRDRDRHPCRAPPITA